MTSRLMIPGPVPVSDSVTQAMAAPVQAHYGPAWVKIYNETLDLLRQVFHTTGDIFLIVGSGTAGLDAAIGSLVGPGQTSLVGVNGYFGHRLAEISRACCARVLEVTQAWGEPLQPDAFQATLREKADISAVMITHVETSTGVLNPVRDIAELANQYAVPILVDAISSLGGVELAMDDWGIDLCVTASQKCLGALAGLAPVAVHPRAWAPIEKRGAIGHGWYLNLLTWREFARKQRDWHPYPVTMPTNAILALRESARELLAEGIPERSRRYQGYATHLRTGLQSLGYTPLAADAWASPVVTAAHSLPGIPSGQVVEFVERVYGLKIAGGGLGPLHDSIFRIGHMAPTTSQQDIDYVLSALEDFKRTI